MEGLFNYVLTALGFVLLIFIFGGTAFTLLGATYAYMRYHLCGIHSPIIDDLFYRASRGEITPPPSIWKGLAPIFIFFGILYFLFR
jgi:hypothetical protein